jgi:hypothetical protein
MRKLSTCLLLALAALLAAGSARAAPRVRLRAEPVPIPGFPGTGFILGHGTALQAEYSIEGTEYGGYPAPLIGVTFYLPKGTRLHPAGFPTCPRAMLEPGGKGPSGCPPGSAAGPGGRALGVVAFGDEQVAEEAKIEPFYAPGGGLEFLTVGHTPVSLEILSSGRYTTVNSGPFGQALVSQIPLVLTVPGAPYASVEQITVRVGSAMRTRSGTIYYGMLPSTCPRGGFSVRSDLTFAAVGGLAQTTVTVAYRAPCPRR